MTGKRKPILVSLILISAVITAAYTAAEIHRDRDYLTHFQKLKGRLITVEETTIQGNPGYRTLQIDLRDDKGLRVAGYVRIPSLGEGPFPALLALGGVRTGRRVLDYIGDTEGVVVFVLDYPYEGKRRKLGVYEFISKLPDMRRALINTVPAAMLAVDYLLERNDVAQNQIVFVGGSVGALLGPAIGAADERISAVALLFGAGDLESVIRANIDVPAPVATAGGWLGSLIVSPLEPLKYVGKISPRPLFMLNGTGDPRMPVAASRRLHESAREPKTIRWIDAGHVDIRSTEFHGRVRDELAAWLTANGLLPK